MPRLQSSKSILLKHCKKSLSAMRQSRCRALSYSPRFFQNRHPHCLLLWPTAKSSPTRPTLPTSHFLLRKSPCLGRSKQPSRIYRGVMAYRMSLPLASTQVSFTAPRVVSCFPPSQLRRHHASVPLIPRHILVPSL